MQILPQPNGQHLVPPAHWLSEKQFNEVMTQVVMIPLVFGQFGSAFGALITFVTGVVQTKPHPFEHF
jgi:hypothetical protein